MSKKWPPAAFGSVKTCPKCGIGTESLGGEPMMLFVEAATRNARAGMGDVSEPVPEHILVTCSRCRHSWKTRTVDAE